MGKYLLKVFKDKDAIKTALREHIEIVEGYFRKYDSVQLLGSIGLYLLDHLPNIEKHFIAQMNGTDMRQDENAEVIAEYAMNFGLALPNDGKDTPTDDVIKQYSVNFYAASASNLNISLILSLFKGVFGFFSNTSIIRCA